MTTAQSGIPADLNAIEAALGRMVYRAGNLEAVVRHTGGLLATTDKQRQALDGVPAGALVDEARKLARKAAADGRISDDALSGLVKSLDEIGSHLKSRNAYIHGMWVSRANGQPFVMLSQKGREVQTRPLAPEELGKLSDTLLTLSNDVLGRTDRVLGAES
ncbi:hypothetical protein [Streptomyces sp. NBC_00996]|uniref:hypothetical protein n=1 Tax=Streptomyces sp. NBC_00996 TaxID=2903710 RepID=UPI00386CF8D0|nr:hypothetical protein OG390_00665 [Streptomyces sp. NBC_00996]